MFTVVGSGFGLYGYLPALVEAFGEPVILPREYEEKVRARPELHGCLDAVRWMPDREAALASASGAVVALPPLAQAEFLRQRARYPGLRRLVIEKPVAPDPDSAAPLLADLRRDGVSYRIGYTLLHARWAPGLAWPRAAQCPGVDIAWSFMAHHFRHGLANWKRDRAQGGGVLRFFGIHLVAMLARHGYDSVARSSLEGDDARQPHRWTAEFHGPGLPPCRVDVDSKSDARRFEIAARTSGERRALVALPDPFDEEAAVSAGADPRVAVLMRLLATFADDDAAYRDFAEATNRLWQRVEGD